MATNPNTGTKTSAKIGKASGKAKQASLPTVPVRLNWNLLGLRLSRYEYGEPLRLFVQEDSRRAVTLHETPWVQIQAFLNAYERAVRKDHQIVFHLMAMKDSVVHVTFETWNHNDVRVVTKRDHELWIKGSSAQYVAGLFDSDGTEIKITYDKGVKPQKKAKPAGKAQQRASWLVRLDEDSLVEVFDDNALGLENVRVEFDGDLTNTKHEAFAHQPYEVVKEFFTNLKLADRNYHLVKPGEPTTMLVASVEKIKTPTGLTECAVLKLVRERETLHRITFPYTERLLQIFTVMFNSNYHYTIDMGPEPVVERKADMPAPKPARAHWLHYLTADETPMGIKLTLNPKNQHRSVHLLVGSKMDEVEDFFKALNLVTVKGDDVTDEDLNLSVSIVEVYRGRKVEACLRLTIATPDNFLKLTILHTTALTALKTALRSLVVQWDIPGETNDETPNDEDSDTNFPRVSKQRAKQRAKKGTKGPRGYSTFDEKYQAIKQFEAGQMTAEELIGALQMTKHQCEAYANYVGLPAGIKHNTTLREWDDQVNDREDEDFADDFM